MATEQIRIRLPLSMTVVGALGSAIDQMWPGATVGMEGSWLVANIEGDPKPVELDEVPLSDDAHVHHVSGDGVVVTPPEDVAIEMARAFAELLANNEEAINYLEVHFARPGETQPWVAVQVIQPDGKTPSELAVDLKARVAELEALLDDDGRLDEWEATR